METLIHCSFSFQPQFSISDDSMAQGSLRFLHFMRISLQNLTLSHVVFRCCQCRQDGIKRFLLHTFSNQPLSPLNPHTAPLPGACFHPQLPARLKYLSLQRKISCDLLRASKVFNLWILQLVTLVFLHLFKRILDCMEIIVNTWQFSPLSNHYIWSTYLNITLGVQSSNEEVYKWGH